MVVGDAMARTPKPADTIKRSLDLSLANDAHLRVLSDETRRDMASVINSELEYVRSFDLPVQSVRRLTADAEKRGSSFRDDVKALLYAAALALPAGVVSTPPDSKESKRSASNINGPNDAWLLHKCVNEGIEFSAALNRELVFARTYGLTPELLARLNRAAAARQIPLRSLVVEILYEVARTLPEAPLAEKSLKTPSKRHK